MSEQWLVLVESISKKFSKRLRYAMWYGLQDLAREMVSFNGSSREHLAHLRAAEFWALRDISFELKPGECLSVIGANGAGKTTLLKLINGILRPDQGRIQVRGRLGALIELGAGFHPMLTGRENIYVSGSILGMSRSEIRAKFDSIVEFAGIEEFLDSPVKSYSSGMNVRLGFSIAIHTDPSVLLIDEVLAVGDVAFQRRCQQRIGDLLKQGVGLILVSHNMTVVQHLSDRVLLLQKGSPLIGPFNDIYQTYLENTLELPAAEKANVIRAVESGPIVYRQTGEVEIREIELTNPGKPHSNLSFQSGSTLEMDVTFHSMVRIESPIFQVSVVREDGIICFVSRSSESSSIKSPDIEPGLGKFRVRFETLLLASGVYLADVLINDSMTVVPLGRKRSQSWRIIGSESVGFQKNDSPVYHQPCVWEWSAE